MLVYVRTHYQNYDVQIAEETVGVLKCASRSLSVVQKHTKLDFSPQKSTESFALYDPTTTCQIIFEVRD